MEPIRIFVGSRRAGLPARLQSPAFYAGLICVPLSAPGPYGLRHVALMALSQIAVAAGAFRALFQKR